MARIISVTHLQTRGQLVKSFIQVWETYSPPIHACTPYCFVVRHQKQASLGWELRTHIHAMTALLKTGHRDPQIPNEARETTGKET